MELRSAKVGQLAELPQSWPAMVPVGEWNGSVWFVVPTHPNDTVEGMMALARQERKPRIGHRKHKGRLT